MHHCCHLLFSIDHFLYRLPLLVRRADKILSFQSFFNKHHVLHTWNRLLLLGIDHEPLVEEVFPELLQKLQLLLVDCQSPADCPPLSACSLRLGIELISGILCLVQRRRSIFLDRNTLFGLIDLHTDTITDGLTDLRLFAETLGGKG